MQTDGLADELAGLADELAGLAAKATKGNLATASKYTEECIECPVCGDGEVDAADYCNFDDKALGVQFYGIGDEFGAHEKLWSAVMQNFDAILAALRQHEQMREALEYIAEEYDAGRHDGLPEPCPAHDADTMFAVALAALNQDKPHGPT
jgi:hypothetical protein